MKYCKNKLFQLVHWTLICDGTTHHKYQYSTHHALQQNSMCRQKNQWPSCIYDFGGFNANSNKMGRKGNKGHLPKQPMIKSSDVKKSGKGLVPKYESIKEFAMRTKVKYTKCMDPLLEGTTSRKASWNIYVVILLMNL